MVIKVSVGLYFKCGCLLFDIFTSHVVSYTVGIYIGFSITRNPITQKSLYQYFFVP